MLQTWHAFALRQRYLRKVKIQKDSLVQVLMRVVSVAQKISTLEEWHHDQSCLFMGGEFYCSPVTEVSVGWTHQSERVDKKYLQSFGW